MTTSIDDAWRLLDNASAWLRHAESKLTTALGFVGVSGAGLFAVAIGMERRWYLLVLACAAAVPLVIAGGIVIRGLVPDRVSTDVLSTVFYADIAQNPDSNTYVEAARTAGHDMGREVLRQVYNVSRVADAKFDDCRSVYLCLGGAISAIAVLAALRVIGFA